ncbi:MAG: PorT family protein [Prevotellaceae bacterium]|jgi:opacity protein-like surface antigen|nr:PorT family protein [Prevotellaceae bacterium]
MKKIIVLLSAMLITLSVTAQVDVKFGVKAGLNVSQLGSGTYEYGDHSGDIDATEMLLGFHVGGFANFNLGPYVGLQPELVFSLQGGKESENDETATWSLGFINVPVLLDIKPIPNLSVFVGPQIGFNVYKSLSNGDESYSGSELDDLLSEGRTKLNAVDVAAVVGVQYTFIEHLTVGVRYNFGFTPSRGVTDEGKDAGQSISGCSHRVIQLSVGWLF